jgi:5-methylcytosine-specific restriction endonuclease McrA
MPRTARNTTTRDRHRATIAKGRPPCGICGDVIDYTLTVTPGQHGKSCTGNCDGCTPHPMSFVVDHVIPLNRGGTDTIANKQAAHRRCNRAKSDRADGGPILRRSGSLTRVNRP